MSAEKLITDHIDIWTSAVQAKSASGRGSSKKRELYGVKKLRELILELAVRGKLVQQDPTDEPASVLLERIHQERVDGKKFKAAKPISEVEELFHLPENWAFTRLESIIQISSGKNLTAKKMDADGCIPVFGGNGITGYHSEHNVTKPTIVIGRVGFYCGSTHLTPAKAWVTDNAFITNFSSSNLKLEFLVWLLKATNLSENDSATAQPVISGKKVYPLVVALPPLAEQNRIVAKVDELMALCDQLEQQTEASLDAHQVLVETLLTTLTNSQDTTELTANWARISEHFDTLFTTEQSIDQLKQTILQLAVMGKLVPQDPTDEPASNLLERIAEEKAQLVKEKKSKKPCRQLLRMKSRLSCRRGGSGVG
ncbi:restriction endonuclease subunit S [Vibrio anguillarum]|uniref:restriction endonuclease subunit S n=1 Tax=Vibrio anguillarum TaxID=55601 RepID=UPI00399D6871